MFKWTPNCSDNTTVMYPDPSHPPYDEPAHRTADGHSAAPRRSPVRRSVRSAVLLLAVALCCYGTSIGTASEVSAAPVTGASFTFTGSGWGHGLGMSQYGAKGMAEAGRSYQQILTTYYQGTRVEPWPVNDSLRILVRQNAPTLTFTSTAHTTYNGVGNVGAGAKVTLTRTGNQIRLSGALNATVNAPLTIRMHGQRIDLAETGNGYRFGQIQVRTDTLGLSNQSGLQAIVTNLTMQEYLYGLAEMPASWHPHALRAQVVAARTFAQRRSDARKSIDYDLTATVADQVYAGTRTEHPNWMDAVNLTAGEVVTYGGQPIDNAVYSSSSGGHSENSEYVWVTAVPYLRGQPDPFEAGSGNPYQSWSRAYTGVQLGAWFGLGTVTSIDVLGPLGVSGRVDKATIRIVGTNGTKDVSGATFRATVNARAGSTPQQLLSTKFTVKGVGAPVNSGPPKGTFPTAFADGRRIVVAGTASDPDGVPIVRVVSTMGSQRAVRDVKPPNGSYLVIWEGAPGTRQICVSVLDVPTGAPTSLGCRNVTVK